MGVCYSGEKQRGYIMCIKVVAIRLMISRWCGAVYESYIIFRAVQCIRAPVSAWPPSSSGPQKTAGN